MNSVSSSFVPGKASGTAVATSLLCVMFLAGLSGCGSGDSSLRGAITLDGDPLPNGAISLVPLDGGPTVGAEIQDGAYRIESLLAGRYRVDILSFQLEEDEAITSSAEMQRRANERVRSSPSREVTAGAVGNGVEFEVTKGSQKHDFALTSPN